MCSSDLDRRDRVLDQERGIDRADHGQMGGLVVDVQDAAFAAKGDSRRASGAQRHRSRGRHLLGNRNRMPEAGGHQGEQPSPDLGDSRSARKSARPRSVNGNRAVQKSCARSHLLLYARRSCLLVSSPWLWSGCPAGWCFERSDVDKDGQWSHQGLQQELAAARPSRRYHRPERAQAGSRRSDQRLPQRSLASAKRQISGDG